MLTEIDMPHIDTPHLFLFFLLYAFIGWVCEEIYCCSLQKKFVYRGMLFGPICPIYGFGGILILYALYPWRTTWVRLYIASMIVTSILEYFTSWLLERLFHAKWWDYSHLPFNLNGRVCLLNSSLFGLGGLALEHFLHPLAEKLIFMPAIQPYIEYIVMALAFILAVDILATIRKLVDFATTMEKLKSFGEQLKDRYQDEEWLNTHSFHHMVNSVREKAKNDSTKFSKNFLASMEKLGKRDRNTENWIKRFPSMSSQEYGEVFEHFRIGMKEYYEEQKKLLAEQKKSIKEKADSLKKKAD